MTDFTDFKAEIKEWANRSDWSDVLTTSYIRMAESFINPILRIRLQITDAIDTITCRCANLPSDWLQMDFVKLQNSNGADGFLPIRYKSRDEFFNLTDTHANGYYTIKGNALFIGGPENTTEGRLVRISYFANIPVFSDDVDSWFYTYHHNVYLFAALMHADLHAVGEEDKAAGLKTAVEAEITKLNAAYLLSKASGSRVTRTRIRTFG